MTIVSSFRNFELHAARAPLVLAASAEVMTLWTTKAGLPPEEARRRLSELVVIVRDPVGCIIGVSTAQQGPGSRKGRGTLLPEDVLPTRIEGSPGTCGTHA